MDEVGITTEWCGIGEKGLIEPKSFTGLSPELKASAYRALAYLLGDPYSSKGLKRTSNAQVSHENGFFFDLLLADSIIKISEEITSFRPTYVRRQEALTAVRGRIDFAKTAKKNFGLLHQHVCDFPELSFDHELIAFLREAVLTLKSRFKKSFSDEMATRLNKAHQIISDFTQQCRLYTDPTATAMKLVLERLTVHPSMNKLVAPSKVIAHFYLGQIEHLAVHSDGAKSQGILLNLNRTFEQLLLKSIIATKNFSHDKDPINDLYFQTTDGTKTSIDPMRPDCKGHIEFNGNTTYLMLDAKHKIFSDGISEDGVDDRGSVSRQDLYQLISYGLTSKHATSTPQIVGLVGVTNEVSVGKRYVHRLADVVVEFNNQKFTLQRYSANFAKLLIDIANCLERGVHPEEVYMAFGHDILAEMGQRSSVKQPA